MDRFSESSLMELPNGLTLVHHPSSSGTIRTGLFFTGGSIDDPLDDTGLTSFLSDAALTPLPDNRLSPKREALALGSTVKTVNDNTIFGWSLGGAMGDLEALLRILHRVGTRTDFDPVQVKMLAARSADQLTSLLDPGVQQALAVAVSSSLGLSNPKALYGNAQHVRNFSVGALRQHWQRMATPSRGVLVALGGTAIEFKKTALQLFGDWKVNRIVGDNLSSCWPDRPTAHLVIDPTATTRRIYTVVALRVPSPGEPGRHAIEMALEAFRRVPGGRLSRVLGETRARDVSPHIVDLGWNNGEKGSILFMRLSGPSRETLRALWDVIETLNNIGSRPPTGEELALAQRHLQEVRDAQNANAVSKLRELAKSVLYGENRYRGQDYDAHVQAIFRRRNISIIGVGPAPLGPVLSELGTLTVWDSGGLILDGNNRPGCP